PTPTYTLSLHDALPISRAVEAGAEVIFPLTNQFYGHRDGRVRDPFGHEWLLSKQFEEVSPGEMQRRWDASNCFESSHSWPKGSRSEEHTSELQSRSDLV